MIYEINEYNENSNIEGTFTDKKFQHFYNETDLKKYVLKHNISAKIFVYDKEEYMAYYNNETDELPEAIEEFNTSDF